MKVKFLKGRIVEGKHKSPGDIADIDTALAASFIASGAAVEHKEIAAPKPKKAYKKA